MTILLNSRDAAVVREAYGGSLPPEFVVLPDHYEPLPEVYPQTIERCRKVAEARREAFPLLHRVLAGRSQAAWWGCGIKGHDHY